uniref:Uncharacterized protein n=1 Tax=Fagus sylvatica TaxID=28930 RepID=A0A2N9FZM7_FAGSY
MEKTKEELKRSRKAAIAATTDDTTQSTDLKAPLLLEKFGFSHCPAVHRKYLRKNICGSISWKNELMEKTRQATYQSDAALFIVFPKRPAQSSMAETPHCPVVTADTATKRSTAAPDVTRNHEKKAGPSLCPLVAVDSVTK